jgi:preprotein translocase subunit YajC
MASFPWTRLILLAEDAPQPAEGQAGSGLLNMLVWFVPIGFLFWFLLIRPQRQEQARRQALLSAVKPNDRVITAGGIYGVVTNVHREADVVTIKVDESNNTKLRVSLGAIARVLPEESSGESPPNKT